MQHIFNMVPTGPKAQAVDLKYARLFNLVLKKRKLLTPFNDLSTKEIHNKLFDYEKSDYYKQIWKSKSCKHIAINYKIAYGLMSCFENNI